MSVNSSTPLHNKSGDHALGRPCPDAWPGSWCPRRTEERSGHGPGGVTWWHPQRCGRRAGIAGISALGRLESKALAQRCPFIVRAEQAALLQHRNHQIHELVTPPRQVRWCDVEPIADALLEPGLHHVG